MKRTATLLLLTLLREESGALEVAGNQPVPFSEWKYTANDKRYVFMGAAVAAIEDENTLFILADFASGELLWCSVQSFGQYFQPWEGGK